MNKAQRAIKTLYERGYRVTEQGKCVNPKGVELSHSLKSNHRYLQSQVNIGGGEMVNFHHHRLAAYCKYGEEIFDKGIVVRHLDGVKTNNSWENIAIGTRSDNEKDKCPKVRSEVGKIANSKRKDVRRLSMRRFTDDEVRSIRRRLANGESGAEIAREYGVVKDTIYQIRRNVTYKDVI